MNSESSNGIIGLAIFALFLVMAASFVMSLISFFSYGAPLPAAALLLVCAATSGFLLKFCFERAKK